MPPRRPALWLDRPALMDRLSSEHAVVALVGPARSGRSSLLAVWSQTVPDVAWMEQDDVPAVERGVLVVDEADRLGPGAWDELGRRLATFPDLRVRLAVTDPDGLPPDWDVDVVTDLYFTGDEVAAYLERAGSSLPARLVVGETDGHPGSVRELARPGIRGAGQFADTLARAGRASVLDPALRVLAVPDRLTEEVVAQLGGPATFLTDAARAGLGTWQTDTGMPVFVLLPTVREATRAAMGITVSQRRAVRLEAATTFLGEGAMFSAFAEAVRGDDLDLAVTALKLGGMSLVVDHGYAISALLRPLPVTRLRRQPVLAITLALVLNARREHRLRAVELFGVAIVGARLGSGQPMDRALTHVVESAARRVIGAGDGGVAAARRATRVLRAAPPEDRESLGRLAPHLHLHAGISLFYGGCDAEAREQFELALATSPEVGTELSAVGGLALADALDGEWESAARWLDHADERVWPPEKLDEYSGSLLRMAQAQAAIDRLDFTAARATLDTIWPIIDTIEHWVLMVYLRALVDIGTGEATAGLERFRSVRRLRTGRLGPPRRVQRLLTITESLLLLATGRPVEAREVLGDPRQDPSAVLAALRVALVLRDTEQALSLLARVVPASPRDRVTLLAFEAVLLHQLERPEDSREVAGKAEALAATHRLRSPFMLLPPGYLELFGDAARDVPEGLATDTSGVPVLTPRERVVLHQLAHTSSLESIAADLHVSVNTVKSQRRSLYRKLGVHSRDDALAEALRLGLLSD